MSGRRDEGGAASPRGGGRYHHRRPLDAAFYGALIAGLDERPAPRTDQLPAEGIIVRLDAGDLLALTQEAGAQVVLLHASNRAEPRERIWTNETSSVENCFMRPMTRLWSTMPWFRTLLTLLEDGVETIDVAGEPVGRHHFVLDGWETPAAWIADGGSADVPSAWDRFARLLADGGIDPRLHRDHVALFRKVAIEPASQRLRMLPSDAQAGDRVVLYAEMDLDVALVPSPYRGGGRPASEMDGSVGAVRVERWASGVEPLGWPYGDVPYPEIGPYVRALEGARS